MTPVADTEAASLTACVAHVLGVDPSEVPLGGGVGLRQWLAGRNLGLVPVASPEGFEWPGRFLGRRRGSPTWAVFFGVPPGVVFDPAAGTDVDGALRPTWRPPSSWRSTTPCTGEAGNLMGPAWSR